MPYYVAAPKTLWPCPTLNNHFVYIVIHIFLSSVIAITFKFIILCNFITKIAFLSLMFVYARERTPNHHQQR